MGIIDRFADIMKSNVNALLDRAEDPSKMVDQTLRDLREDLAKVKTETANVMAEEKRCKRELDDCDAEISRMDAAARKAVMAGNDDDARVLLEQKAAATERKNSISQAYTVAHQNVTRIREMYDKLVADINEMESRKAAIKAKLSVAEAQKKMNRMTSGINTGSSMEAFDRMEAKADRMLDAANAMTELNQSTVASSADDIAGKYETGSAAVEDELAKLKAEMAQQ